MNIIFACDNQYVPYLAVTMSSVVKHSRSRIHFYVLDLGISEEGKRVCTHLAGNHLIDFISVDTADFESLPLTIAHISIACYTRLKVAEYLKDCHRAIYLDIDLLVCQDLTPLWETDLQGNYLGACFDCFIEYREQGYKQSIGLTEHQPYFNAGVLLIDLDKWRSADVLEAGKQWILQYPNMRYQDQDILNGLFANKVKLLDSRYNFMSATSSYLMGKQNELPSHAYCGEIMPATPISIFHYPGPAKPWNRAGCQLFNAYYYLNIFEEIKHQLPQEWYPYFVSLSWLDKIIVQWRSFKMKIKYGLF